MWIKLSFHLTIESFCSHEKTIIVTLFATKDNNKVTDFKILFCAKIFN